MSRFAFCKGVFALALASAAAVSQAVIAFDNFGPGDTYNTGSGWTVAGSTSPVGPVRVAMQFYCGATGMLDSITLPVQYVGGTNQVGVILRNDAGGVIGNWLIQSSPSNLPVFGSGAAPLVVTNPFTDANIYPHLVLQEGLEYWLEVSPVESLPVGDDTGPDSQLVWNLNSVGDLGTIGRSFDNGSSYEYFGDQHRGAFRVELLEADAVPGPMAALPFFVGALAAMRRRRK